MGEVPTLVGALISSYRLMAIFRHGKLGENRPKYHRQNESGTPKMAEKKQNGLKIEMLFAILIMSGARA